MPVLLLNITLRLLRPLLFFLEWSPFIIPGDVWTCLAQQQKENMWDHFPRTIVLSKSHLTFSRTSQLRLLVRPQVHLNCLEARNKKFQHCAKSVLP